ncbi:MAG: AraC family transcriptional regulator [Clostridiales bacterium]|nr:AraC family transcriptional regulator [Clostridiales bacterium]
MVKGSILFDQGLDIFLIRHPCFSSDNIQNHGFFEIAYVMEGSCIQKLLVRGSLETYELREGDLILIPPGQEHSIMVDSKSTILNIGIRAATFQEAFMNNIPGDSILGNYFTQILYYHKNTNYLIFHTGEDRPLQHLINDMAVTYCNNNNYSKNLMNLQLSTLFLHLIQDYCDDIDFSYEAVESAHIIPSIILYLEKNYAETSIAAIAGHFGYSSDHLNRIFKQYTSQTLSEALLKIRMQNACRLINDTVLPVSEVAHLVGYKDATNFIRNFRKSYGITPAKYKRCKF